MESVGRKVHKIYMNMAMANIIAAEGSIQPQIHL